MRSEISRIMVYPTYIAEVKQKAFIYRIAGNFDGFDAYLSKFSLSIFSIQLNCIANTGCLRDYPSIFPPSKFPAIRYAFNFQT